jgi:hypothetical protein
MKETRNYSTTCKLRWLVTFVILALLLSGCENGIRIYGGIFEDSHLFLNTKLDAKLKNEIMLKGCFNMPPKDILDRTSIERFISSRIEIFHELFPKEASAKTVLKALKDSHALCRAESKDENIIFHCTLTKEYIYGNEELYLTGWKVHSVYLTKSSFEYLLTTQADRILNVNINNIGCEYYLLDKDLYQKSKIIKPIRRIK